MTRKNIQSSLVMFILCCLSLSAQAQIDASPYGENTRKSIWDKEVEPKTDPATSSPFQAGTQQRVSTQQNGTLANPPAFDANTTDGVPIDGGISLLLAAGALYGAKKTYQLKKIAKSNKQIG